MPFAPYGKIVFLIEICDLAIHGLEAFDVVLPGRTSRVADSTNYI